MFRKRLTFLILLFCLIFPAFAEEDAAVPAADTNSETRVYSDEDYRLLLAERVFTATEAELNAALEANGLSSGGSAEEKRARLYGFYGLSVNEEDLSEEEREPAEYTFTLDSAETVRRIPGENGDLVVLDGGVTVTLESGEDDKQVLHADRIMLESGKSYLIAFGNIGIEDSDSSSPLQQLEGTVLAMRWNGGSITVKDAVGVMERTNADDESVSFYMRGSEIVFSSDTGETYFSEGTIATRAEDPYWSISAADMIMKGTGDFFVTSATVRMGRVPLLWLPAFFLPGSSLTFNPAIGFSSQRGAFLNTTYELYGSYPDLGEGGEQSSFTSLFSSSDTGGGRAKDGILYVNADPDEEKSDFQKWAEDTESYMTLFADYYVRRGLYLGLDTDNNLADDSVNLSLLGGAAFYPHAAYTSVSASNVPNFRYGGVFSGSVNTSGVRLSANMTFYSDSYFAYDYWNRFTGFSFDSLFGGYITFPTDYSYNLTTPQWNLSGSYTLPSSLTSKFLSNFSISDFDITLNWLWTAPSSEEVRNGRYVYSYKTSTTTLPSFSASLGGTIFSIGGGKRKVSIGEGQGEISALADELISKREEGGKFSNETGTAAPDFYFRSADLQEMEIDEPGALALTYTLSETFSNTYAASTSSSLLGPETLYSATSGSLQLTGSLENIVTATQTFTPSYTYSYAAATDNTRTNTFQVNTKSVVSIPFIGLTYTIGGRLYYHTYSRTGTEEAGNVSETSEESWMAWNSDTVTTHEASLSKKFGDFTLGLTGTLPPLTVTITPSLRFAHGAHSAYTTHRITNSTGVYGSSLTTLGYAFRTDANDFSLDLSYSHADYSAETGWFAPFHAEQEGYLRFFDRNLRIGEEVEFHGYYDGYTNYFDGILLSASVGRISSSDNYLFTAGLLFDGEATSLGFSQIQLDVNLEDITFLFWKNRIRLFFGLEGSAVFDFRDIYGTGFRGKLSLGMEIVEFLTITFDVTSANNAFYAYYNDDGAFSFAEMFADLGRSFDFFGDGRYNTRFVMDSMHLDIMHEMKDWDFHCTYTASVVLSGNEWEWTPTVSVYMQWKTIPELKVDRTLRETGGTWKNED